MRDSLYRLVCAILAGCPRLTDYLLARAKRTPYKHIRSRDGKSPYMRRWWLFNPYDDHGGKRKYPWIPFSIRFHEILRADEDAHQHDHPWDARTLILRGYYIEERGDDGLVLWREAGETATLKYGEFHRIQNISSGGVLTLFIVFKYRGTWGFKVNGVKVHWREYLFAKAEK